MWSKCIGTSKRNKQELHEKVYMLDFSDKMLEEFPKLSKREYKITTDINFDNNRITMLPKDLFKMTNLRKISFQENNITCIPPDICKLKELEDVNFSKNELVDVCEELFLCRNIKKLDLSCNALQLLRDDITLFPHLEVLILTDITLNDIPETISRLSILKVFEARDNFLSILPYEIGELVSLKRLDLGCNEITNIPPSIRYLTHLEELYLDSNSLINIPSEIKSCSMLHTLDLSCNAISLLPEEIGLLENLTELTLTNNQLVKLPNTIGGLKSLKTLRLEDNMLKELPNSITELQNLEDLYIKNNSLQNLPENIGHMESLSVLYIDNNSLTTLPDSICECKMLKILSFIHNRIKKLPKDFGKLKMLYILDASENRLEYLPYSFKNLNLKAFWLCSGQMNSLIPLQYYVHPTEGHVLTCYLLPQSITKIKVEYSYFGNDNSMSNGDSIILASEDILSSENEPLQNLCQDKQILEMDTPDLTNQSASLKATITAEETEIEIKDTSVVNSVFSEASETETIESHSSFNKYMSVTSSHTSSLSSSERMDEPQLDEFMSVTQEMHMAQNQLALSANGNSENTPILPSDNIDTTSENITVVQLPIKKMDDFIVERDSIGEHTFVDTVNKNFANIQRGDLISKINTVSVEKLTLDKINTMIQSTIDKSTILEVTIQKFKPTLPINQLITDNKIHADFETRVVYVQSIELTDFGALPIFFEGGTSEHILPFGNEQSPIFVSFVDMDLFRASSIIYEGDRVIEINNEPIDDELKENNSLTQFFFKNRYGIRSITLRSDPPVDFFKKIIIQKVDNSFGFSTQGGYYYHGALRPNYISAVHSNCLITNGAELRVGMWVIEINGTFVLHRRHNEIIDIIASIDSFLTMIVFDVEQRSTQLRLPGTLSSIPCTIDIINKYDAIEQYFN